MGLLPWFQGYGREDARGDLAAGLTVGVVLIPQGMAYAVLAGVPPIYGLYASLVPLLVYPFLGTSRHLAAGMTAVTLVIVATGVGQLAEPGTEAYVTLVVLLTALVGILELTMGVLRLGFLADLLSKPVITGFTAAAAILIVVSQAGNLVGVPVGASDKVFDMLGQALSDTEAWHAPTVLLGGAAIALLVAIRTCWRAMPAEILVLVAATVVCVWLDLPARGVEVVGSVPTGLPAFRVPSVDAGAVAAMWPTVVSLALVEFLSVVSIARAFAARHRYSVDANRELVAVGAGNFIGSFFRIVPSSGSFSRTAVNEQAGARTPLANVAAAGVVALTLLFLTPLFSHVPMPVLGAIIVVAGASLLDLREVRYLFRAKKSDGWVAALTFVATLLLGVEEGILLGVVAAVVVVLYWLSRPNVAELGLVPGTRSYRSRESFGDSRRILGVLIVRVDAGFSFFNAQFLKEFLLRATDRNDRPPRAVVLDGMSMNFLDTTAVGALQDLIESLQRRDVQVYLTGLTRPVRKVIEGSGLGEWLGEQRFFMSPHEAVEHLLERWDREEGTERLQRYRDVTEEEGKSEARADDTRFT